MDLFESLHCMNTLVCGLKYITKFSLCDLCGGPLCNINYDEPRLMITQGQ